MSRVIRIGKELVPVSEEIYKEYYRMKRRERYFEKDIKVGRSVKDPETGKVKEYKPSKEDSIQRLMEKGQVFTDDELVEDIVCDKAMLIILQEAMKELNEKEQELIQDLFYKNNTVREVANKEKVSHVAIIKRRDKILKKLKKHFT
jgi:DNA-directed RNA polymerase specialized sigma subunit